MLKRAVLTALLVTAVAAPAASASAPVALATAAVTNLSGLHCTGNPSQPYEVTYDIAGTHSYAVVAAPASAPKGLVMTASGYGASAIQYLDPDPALGTQSPVTLARAGAIAVVPHLRNTTDHADGTIADDYSTGAPIKTAAEDLIALTRAIDDACHPATRVLKSTSLGGAAAGIALTAHPKRSNGKPLFDLWAGGSSLYDLVSFAPIVDTVGSAEGLVLPGSFYGQAAVDYRAEFGGAPETHLAAVIARSPDAHLADIASSGIQRAELVHAAAEYVPATGAIQAQQGLIADGVPTDLRVLTLASPGEAYPGTSYLQIASLGLVPQFGVEGHVGDNVVAATDQNISDWLNAPKTGCSTLGVALGAAAGKPALTASAC